MSTERSMPEWKKQAELRAARKRNKPSKKVDLKKPSPTNIEIKSFKFVLSPAGSKDLAAAYHSLMTSGILTTYARKFRYHEHCQRATMTGSFTIELPFVLISRLQSEIAGVNGFWCIAKKEVSLANG